VWNHKTDYHNIKETDQYRKIPLHPFVIEALKHYINNNKEERKITRNDYIFGTPKMNPDLQIMDGVLHQSKFKRAIVYFYKQIKLKEKMAEHFNKEDFAFTDIKELENIETEMLEKNIRFYSLRHTFNTMCVLFRYGNAFLGNDDLIDYFTGHKIQSQMRGNYSQLNKIDNISFYNEYGKFVIDMLNKYVFYNETEKETKEAIYKKLAEKMKDNANVKNIINREQITALDLVKLSLPFALQATRNEVKEDSNDDIFGDT
jgi:hypothetical protein